MARPRFELFYLKDPDSKRDVLCAIIEFRNLKGRPEGADGTKFFMHGDYQLAYCPITQIISSETRSVSSPPVEAGDSQCSPPSPPYAYELHKSLPMTYDSSRQALQELGRDARFEDDIGHYNYRRWTANEVNRNFTSQERQRVLGQSGDAVFEKHYQSQFIGRDLQHVGLLRPPQEGLLRLAGSMLRKRDPLAPSSELSDAQRRAICQNPEILELRREKRELMEEMRSLAGTIKKAQKPFPHLYDRHEEVKKKLSQLRKTETKNTQETARKEYFHDAPVLEVDRQIKQLLGQSDEGDGDAPNNSEDEDWELPTPDYVFPERARLVDNFYGPEGENFDEDKLVARRIQVTKDMVALSQLYEPTRGGKRINWDVDDDFNESRKSEEPLPTEKEVLECPPDVCILCYGLSRDLPSNSPPHQFPPKRMDSLRRHLIDSHLSLVHDGISCNWAACRDVPRFAEITEFLAHAVKVHAYDVNIKLHHLPQRPRPASDDSLSHDSTEASPASESRSGTETPASSVGSEMANIDPRLLGSYPATAIVTKPPLRRSKRLRLE